MLRRILIIMGVLVVVGLVAAWLLTMPRKLPASVLTAGYQPNLANGEVMFNAGNCSACHMTQGQDDRTQLAGGLKLKSPFGTFVAPNISPDPKAGIGAWSELEFVNAVKRGVGRRGEHLYPAFPFTAYAMMPTNDVRDLFAYIKTLPASPTPTAGHDLGFPYNIRLAVGGWKLLYFHPKEFAADPKQSAAWNRGRYLAEGPGHCAECHTPRGPLGGPEEAKLYAGAPNLEKGGRFAINITSHPKDGIGDWSQDDIASLLSTGTNRCFNEPEGMRGVLASTMKLPADDIAALATYIKTLPAKAGNGKEKTC